MSIVTIPPRTRATFLFAFVAALPSAAADEAVDLGRRIYADQCAACHGESGEGVEGLYDFPLESDASPETLTAYIAGAMPEGEPEACVGEDAAAVARFLSSELFRPPTGDDEPVAVPLARLTVPQLRQGLADLLTPANAAAERGDARGLRAEYYRGAFDLRRRRGAGRKKVAVERVSPGVDVDYGLDPPAGLDVADERGEFGVIWTGSLVAPETGTYDVYVDTPNAFLLYLNGGTEPLIDAAVRSGDRTAYRASVPLLAGRAHPIRIEFTKRLRRKKQGKEIVVLDEPLPAAITLSWRPPHGAKCVVPSRRLIPVSVPPVFVCSTPLPPDDVSTGYPRGTLISPEWDEATTEAAIEAAGFVEASLDVLARTRPDDPKRLPKLRRFATDLLRRAVGAKPDAATRGFVDATLGDDPARYAEGVAKLTLYATKSPLFLYPSLRPEDAASPTRRLAATLWDSLPDHARPMRDDRPVTAETLRADATAMLDDPRAGRKIRDFFHAWLGVSGEAELHKSRDAFPGFDADFAGDLETSLDLFLEDFLSGDSDFARLFLDPTLFVNDRLAAAYGLPGPGGNGFSPVEIAGRPAAGVMTHPLLMARYAHAEESSPIHRGVFLARRVMGHSLRPPQEAFAPFDAELHPSLTTRERVTLQTGEANCMVCHETINPLGFVLENFDALGRFRTHEGDRPVDASVRYRPPGGEPIAFAGVADWAAYAADSGLVRRTFVRQAFEYFTGRPPAAYGRDRLDALGEAFEASGRNVRELFVEIAVVAAEGTPDERAALAATDANSPAVADAR